MLTGRRCRRWGTRRGQAETVQTFRELLDASFKGQPLDPPAAAPCQAAG